MKKSLLISASLLTLSVVTGIYAQTTTGASIVDKMKAVAHSFTLGSILNPTDTGLTSDPVKGKKTGDILTAGEWNRVLELVSEGGGSTNSENSYLQLTTPSSVTFVEGGKVPFTTVVSQKGSQITQNSGEITLKGGSSYRISSDLRLTSPNSGIGYTIVDKTTGTGVGVFGANYTGTYTGSWGGTSALALVSPTVDTTYFIKTSSLSGGPYSTSGAGHFTVEELGGSGGSSSTGNGEMVMSEMSPTTYANLIDAVNYCRNLTENGITNWKFPTYGDLVNFIDLKYPQDMVWVADFDVSVGASTYIIKDYFASMRLSDGYWSVSTLADGANKVRCVAQTGGIGGGNSGSGIASRAAALRAAGYTLPIPSTITDWPNQIICAGSGGAAGSGVVFDLFEAGISSVSYASQDGYGVWFNPTTGAISTVGRTDPKCGASLADIGTMCKEGRCVYGSNSAPTPSNLVYINPDNTNFTPLECKPGMNYMIDAISFNATSASAYTTMKLAVLKSGNWKAKGTGFVRNRNINSNSTQTFRFSSILDGVTTNLFENTADTGIYASSFSEDISVPAGKTTEINVSVRNNIVYGGTVTLWCTN